MHLPESFLNEDEDGVRGGVEYGFMSTTTSEAVAIGFAKRGGHETAATLFVTELGMIDRGASLGWLSQYPEEAEILLPPLSAMEVLDVTDFEHADDGIVVRKVTVRLNCNMISMTLDKLQGVRKAQATEMIDIIENDLLVHDMAADIRGRIDELQTIRETVEATDQNVFNSNIQFSTILNQALEVMPKLGDEMLVLTKHHREVNSLLLVDSDTFVSSSWDGTACTWKLSDEMDMIPEVMQLSSASCCLAKTSERCLMTGQLNGAVCVYDMVTSRLCNTIDLRVGDAATAVAYNSTSGALAVGTMSGRIHLRSPADADWSSSHGIATDTGESTPHAHVETVRGLVWICEQRVLISGSFDKSIMKWVVKDGSLVHQQTYATQAAVTCLIEHETSGSVVFGSEDGSVSQLDSISGKTFQIAKLGSGVCSIAWLSNPIPGDQTAWVACGLGDGTTVVHETQEKHGLAPAPICVLNGHKGGVRSLLWHEDRGCLISGGSDGTIRMWRIRVGAQ